MSFFSKRLLGFKLNLSSTEKKVSPFRFHSIIVKIVDGIFNMLVDDNVHRRAFNESDALVFDTIQFGAPIPTDVSEVGVTACVKNVYVDHVDIIELAVLTNDSRVRLLWVTVNYCRLLQVTVCYCRLL